MAESVGAAVARIAGSVSWFPGRAALLARAGIAGDRARQLEGIAVTAARLVDSLSGPRAYVGLVDEDCKRLTSDYLAQLRAYRTALRLSAASPANDAALREAANQLLTTQGRLPRVLERIEAIQAVHTRVGVQTSLWGHLRARFRAVDPTASQLAAAQMARLDRALTAHRGAVAAMAGPPTMPDPGLLASARAIAPALRAAAAALDHPANPALWSMVARRLDTVEAWTLEPPSDTLERIARELTAASRAAAEPPGAGDPAAARPHVDTVQHAARLIARRAREQMGYLGEDQTAERYASLMRDNLVQIRAYRKALATGAGVEAAHHRLFVTQMLLVDLQDDVAAAHDLGTRHELQRRTWTFLAGALRDAGGPDADSRWRAKAALALERGDRVHRGWTEEANRVGLLEAHRDPAMQAAQRGVAELQAAVQEAFKNPSAAERWSEVTRHLEQLENGLRRRRAPAAARRGAALEGIAGVLDLIPDHSARLRAAGAPQEAVIQLQRSTEIARYLAIRSDDGTRSLSRHLPGYTRQLRAYAAALPVDPRRVDAGSLQAAARGLIIASNELLAVVARSDAMTALDKRLGAQERSLKRLGKSFESDKAHHLSIPRSAMARYGQAFEAHRQAVQRMGSRAAAGDPATQAYSRGIAAVEEAVALALRIGAEPRDWLEVGRRLNTLDAWARESPSAALERVGGRLVLSPEDTALLKGAGVLPADIGRLNSVPGTANSIAQGIRDQMAELRTDGGEERDYLELVRAYQAGMNAYAGALIAGGSGAAIKESALRLLETQERLAQMQGTVDTAHRLARFDRVEERLNERLLEQLRAPGMGAPGRTAATDFEQALRRHRARDGRRTPGPSGDRSLQAGYRSIAATRAALHRAMSNDMRPGPWARAMDQMRELNAALTERAQGRQGPGPDVLQRPGYLGPPATQGRTGTGAGDPHRPPRPSTSTGSPRLVVA